MTFYTIVDMSKGSEHTINLTHKYKQAQLRKIGPIAQYSTVEDHFGLNESFFSI